MTDAYERARQALEDVGGLVAGVALARQWGLSKQRVSQLAGNRDRNGFPEPIDVEDGPPVFLHGEVDAWHEQRSRAEP